MKVKNLVLGIGIFIVFMFLLHNGIRAFYSEPKYEQFCDNTRLDYYSYPEKISPTYGMNCTYPKQLRETEQKCYNEEGQPIYEYDDNGCQISVEECDFCKKYLNDAEIAYQKIVFVIAIIVGIIILIVGYSVLSIEPVGSSLMASGIGAIVYGTIYNWQNLDNLSRFFLLLISFIIIIWIAIKLNTLKQKKKSFWQKIGLRK